LQQALSRLMLVVIASFRVETTMFRRRPRLDSVITKTKNRSLLAFVIAVGVFSLPLQRFELRVLLAYDLGSFAFLAMLIARMVSSDTEETYHRAQREEPSNVATLATVGLFSSTSLVAIALMLDNTQKASSFVTNIHMGLSLVAIFLSWLLLHTYFALHYARIYYDEIELAEAEEGSYIKGLDFPNIELVNYWDFLYFSFTIAMCYQTSDVTVVSEEMRRLTLIHAIISFMFVSLILGLVINLVSNVV